MEVSDRKALRVHEELQDRQALKVPLVRILQYKALKGLQDLRELDCRAQRGLKVLRVRLDLRAFKAHKGLREPKELLELTLLSRGLKGLQVLRESKVQQDLLEV